MQGLASGARALKGDAISKGLIPGSRALSLLRYLAVRAAKGNLACPAWEWRAEQLIVFKRGIKRAVNLFDNQNRLFLNTTS